MEPIHLVHEYLVENGIPSERYRSECGNPLLLVGDFIKVSSIMTKVFISTRGGWHCLDENNKSVWTWYVIAEFDLHNPTSLFELSLCLCDQMAHIPDNNGQLKLPLERLWQP